jgi:hypothetical protein
VSRSRLLAAGAVLGAAAAGAGLWLGLSGGGSPAPTPQRYLADVSTVCRSYARRLERVPAPSDPAAYGNVIASLERVLPLLRAQEAAMRATPPPPALEARLGRLFALNERSVTELEAVLAAAKRRNAGGVATGLARFSAVRDRVHAAAVAVGVQCDPN